MSDLVSRLQAALGAGNVLTGANRSAQSNTAPSRPLGAPLAVVRPASTDEVAQVLRLCHAARQPVVAWGGKTGLVEGTFAEGAVALSLERMNRIEEIDALGATMTAEAGCVLQTACETAEAKGLFLPLDLGARGSCTIGGNISTNAGGNRVIRYGMMREMVLGLEAVLADGTVVSSLNRLIKNNAGYDLKQLFIGSEGTLGIVTRAVLRLRPKPISQSTAFLALDEFAGLPRLLRRVEQALGGTLAAFEVMWPEFYALVTTPPAKGRAPIPHGRGYYVLVEALGGDQGDDEARFERALMAALEAGDAADAVIAKSESERQQMWGLRDDVAQLARNFPIFIYDVSLPVMAMESYVAEIRSALTARWPKSTCVIFGHLGDGNLHVIVGVGDSGAAARQAVEEIIYGALRPRGGSISAEHGIGLEKRPYLAVSRSPEEIALMRRLKQALDPENILNPGKVLASGA
jgi:FAD/FMN-containing dehydrogenase